MRLIDEDDFNGKQAGLAREKSENILSLAGPLQRRNNHLKAIESGPFEPRRSPHAESSSSSLRHHLDNDLARRLQRLQRYFELGGEWSQVEFRPLGGEYGFGGAGSSRG